MRTRAAVATALASVGILIAGWQSGAHVSETGAATSTSLSSTGSSGTTSGGSTSGTGSSGTASGGSSSSGTTSSGTSTATSGSYDGSSVQTRYGTVQVQVTVQGGKITEVKALQLTDAENRSAQISAYAAPVLRSEVLQAQSANVQTVGGATITSDAYLTSLQAALDAAHF
ncbi:FMN-binding protein [Arthrobacter sp. fls2-241-R2A-200]|uniref:FMN-binding protein n=1 Tax=Arthrobacter sp. fls2-241-R2A-200 TaxID=3040281 RepID=UPI00254EDE13|nr:FMN-binding protein [Arthrobacter sp. fls2-241-R2A-200]